MPKNYPLQGLTPYTLNAKKHDKKQVANIAESLREFGWRQPIVIDKDGVVIIGHGRLLAAQSMGLTEGWVEFADDLTPEQIKKLRIVDNKTNESAWDFEALAQDLDGLDLSEFDMDFGLPEIAPPAQQIVEDNPDDLDTVGAIDVKPGDVFTLGRHRLMCGDSCNAEDVAKLMAGEIADLVFTDPPYGMKKESDGVMNDNQNRRELLEFNKKWIPLSFAHLKGNGSWYCWGIDQPLFDIYSHILVPMMDRNEITFRNYLTWAKHSAHGVNWAGGRSYPPETEKCLFVMCGVQGFNNNAEHYNDAFQGIRAYMEQQAQKAGLTPKKLREITGLQMYSHWFSKSQFTVIHERHYRKLQEYFAGAAFELPYSELVQLRTEETDEYKNLKESVLENRAYFDNAHNDSALYDIMTDVWRFPQTSQKERECTGGHATPKPLALCARGIKSSSREGETVLDMFGGSGSTMIACEQTNRRCVMMEMDPHYCQVIIRRWEKFTGAKAARAE